jgi:hypothetical protein
MAKKSPLRGRSQIPPFGSIRKIVSLAPYLASIARTRLREIPRNWIFRDSVPLGLRGPRRFPQTPGRLERFGVMRQAY